MNKRVPGRIAKAKGFNSKYALQIFILLGVCCWLIYQVKRSHDKGAELKVAPDDESLIALGRKGLDRQVETGKHKDEEEEEEEGDTRLEQEIEAAEMRHREEESRLDEKERDSDDKERETEEEEDEEKLGKDQDLDEGEKGGEDDLDEGDEESKEAREENYKADDVSSEVAHHEEEAAADTNQRHLGENSTDTEKLELTFDDDSMKSSSSLLGFNSANIEENRTTGNETEEMTMASDNEEEESNTSDSSAENGVELGTLPDFELNGVNDRNAETD